MKNHQNLNGSVGLAWATTIAYGIIYCAILFVVSQYWLMLPIWLRSIAALGLVGLAGIGIFRIWRSYKQQTAASRAKDEKKEK